MLPAVARKMVATVEAIAARAGVSKKTIYRWWPSKGAVVLEALTELAEAGAPQPADGLIADDIRAQMAPDADQLILELLYGPVYYRMLLHLGPHSPESTRRLIDHVITSFAP
jgi:AcrR family transcriptional regulator